MVDFGERNVSIFVDLKSGLVSFDLFAPNSLVSNLIMGKLHKLGRCELSVLIALFESMGAPLSRNELIDSIWKNKFVTDNTLSVSISKLRKLLANIDCHEDLKTISCYGYMLYPERGNYQRVINEKVQQLIITTFVKN